MSLSKIPEAPPWRAVFGGTLTWDVMGAAIATIEAIAVFGAAFAIGYGYDTLIHDSEQPLDALAVFAVLLAAVYAGVRLLGKAFRYEAFLPSGKPLERTAVHWCISFLLLLALLFISKSSTEYSRGAATVLFAAGLALVILLRAASVRLAMFLTQSAVVSSRRTMLVGHQDRIADFLVAERPAALGIEIVGTVPLSQPGGDDLRRELDQVVNAARRLRPNEIMLVLPWSDLERIKACTFRLMELPVGIQLAPEALFRHFPRVATARLGEMTSLMLVDRPLSRTAVALKRTMDIVLASAGLLVLMPIFALVAGAIKADSPGPVFYRQRRYGFNRQEFKVFKFRSMYVTELDREFRQATAHDPRITRVGRLLRRTNLDELPQLLNVLLGSMSLVGPRPHPLALDDDHLDRIALYARRHNIKPGITGWAQVNGFRGETGTGVKMRARLVYDIYYLDNWSLGFDVIILLLTVFSRRSFRNAG